MLRALCLALAAVLAASPAAANDSTAELRAGGLVLVRNDAVELLSEDLFISPETIRIAYRFRNTRAEPVTYLVAFPLPAIDAVVPEAMNMVIPNPASENFVDFRVTVDGVPVTPSIAARALAMGVDRTDELRRLGLPLNPIAEGLYERLDALPAAEKTALNRVGLVYVDDYATQAAWRFEAAFYWEQTFPPGKEIVVEHSYRPVVGHAFFGTYVLDAPVNRTTYCIDAAFDRAARTKLAAIAKSPNPYLSEMRIGYILTTANNWFGPIKKFRLVVDKGTPDSLVSFCGTGVRKISPTQFEMTATDFIPEKDLEILIAAPPVAFSPN